MVTGPIPVFNNNLSVYRTTRIRRFAEHGWKPSSLLWFLQITQSNCRDYKRENLLPDVKFRTWKPDDNVPLEEMIQTSRWTSALADYRKSVLRGDSTSQVLVVVVSGRIAGFCQWVRGDQITDYGGMGSIFALVGQRTLPAEQGYILTLMVDPLFRGKGMGRALFVKSCQAQFQIGIKEIQGWAPWLKFYERLGCKVTGQFLQMGLQIQ